MICKQTSSLLPTGLARHVTSALNAERLLQILRIGEEEEEEEGERGGEDEEGGEEEEEGR